MNVELGSTTVEMSKVGECSVQENQSAATAKARGRSGRLRQKKYWADEGRARQ